MTKIRLHCGLFKPCAWRSAHRFSKPATAFCLAFDSAGDPCNKPATPILVANTEDVPEFSFCAKHTALLNDYFTGPDRRRTLGDEPTHVSLDIPAEPNEPWLDSPGFVYFARSGDKVKIGWSTNPEKRLATIRVATPDGIDEWVARSGSPADEKFYHRRYREHRLNGEWFSVTPEIRETMDALHELASV